MQMTEKTEKWWQRAVFYQIYPRSFRDANADGIGDIRGIIEKLDYLEYLGVNAIWVSPVYQSPMKDNGYDISNYYEIHPEFGTMDEIKELISEAKKRGIRVIMDLVVNHCSDKHPWFLDALANKNSPYRDYFILRKTADGKAPTNWRAVFGGCVWDKFDADDTYYYHTFLKEQPDLNWENPKLRKEIYEMMNFWLDLGIDGFRIDAITYIKKDLSFPMLAPDRADGLAQLNEVSENYPGIEVFFAEMKRETYGRYDSFSVAEISRANDEMVANFIGEDGVFDSIFDFSYLWLGEAGGKWYEQHQLKAKELADIMFRSQYQAQRIGGYYSTVLENHDQHRSLNKYLGDENISFEGAAMLATLNLTLRGVPFIYQGEEIGMTDCQWESLDEIDDVSTHGEYAMARLEGLDEAAAFAFAASNSRDNARTPMQWDDSASAGFTAGEPWLRVNENYESVNVKNQMHCEKSLLQYYRKLIAIRKSKKYSSLLNRGEIAQIVLPDETVIAYERVLGQDKMAVVLNYDNSPKDITTDVFNGLAVLLGNYQAVAAHTHLHLRPYEAIVFIGNI